MVRVKKNLWLSVATGDWQLASLCLAEGLNLHRKGAHRRSPGQLAALAHPGLSELEEFGSDRFTSDGLRPQLANDPWTMTPGCQWVPEEGSKTSGAQVLCGVTLELADNEAGLH